LNITFTNNLKVFDGMDDCVVEEEIFLVGEGLRGSDNDGFTSGYPLNQVLHVADSDTVVVAIAYYFVFDFLPSFQGFFD